MLAHAPDQRRRKRHVHGDHFGEVQVEDIFADAAYTRKNYDNDINAGFHVDPVAGVNSMRRLKEIEKDYKTGVKF